MTKNLSMKCLVLGGGGFLGERISSALALRGYNVSVFERPRACADARRRLDGQVSWLDGDFTNPNDVDGVLRGCEAVFHFIATTLPKGSNDNPVYDISSNVLSTLHMLELAVKHGVRKIVFVSSGGTVYGIPKTIPIPETHSTDPLCSYGISKLTIEKYFALFKSLYGLDYVILRLANPYGKYQRVEASQGVIPVFLYRTLRGEPIEIWGDGSVVRDYFYIDDAVDALLAALEYQGSHNIFNIGSGIGHSLNEILDIIERVVGIKPIVRYTPTRSFDVPKNILDVTLADKELQWSHKVAIDEGILRLSKYISSLL